MDIINKKVISILQLYNFEIEIMSGSKLIIL